MGVFMDKKIAIFAFNDEIMCFYHAMLTALDMHNKGFDVKFIFEGKATIFVEKLNNPDVKLADKYVELKEKNLIDCVCDQCSMNTGSRKSALEQGLKVCNEMSGHPAMAGYIEKGYQIITF